MSKDRPTISEEDALAAKQVLRDIADGKYDGADDKIITRRMRAASTLGSLYQTQQRFSGSHLDHLMAGRPSGNVKRLHALTTDGLAELQAQMTADYPGKPKSEA